ncbi:hypothetical protein H8S37_04745 [Mediterraneibacter sp. NSJ-55]|uniref:DUF6558 domain-containing protein n=1 Tax=Mediterraneibacter hominis TaxID=2763054 RepID=A0A923LGC9_9FIRM|nr:phage tail domain-containing protein [Mediterraneibacter hominis]MBC5688237.1 hypothetical protein [Mediterraneibacter hominis]
MILVCKDFNYDNKSLINQKYMSVNFEDDTSLPSSISRTMETSDMNKYRPEENGFGITYSEVLEFEVHIVKNFDEFTSQSEMEFSNTEYEKLVSWLTSPQTNQWMEVTKESGEKTKVKGYFSSVEPYDNWGICYGAKCTFTCNSPFSYTSKEIEQTISGVTNFLVNNESSELYDYVYPTLLIEPTKNEEIYIHNLSDSIILENSTITLSEDTSSNITALQQKISSYAALNNLTVEYVIDDTTQDLKLICDNTGLLFYMTDSYGIKNKYVAYYLKADGQYFICQSGFFYCKLSQALKVKINCKNLGMYDSLGRPVLFDTMGIQDEDEIYWLRLIHGNNSFRVMGNCKITISYLEAHKGGLIS